MFTKELEAIKRSGRLRTRKLFHADHIDLASNDYLKLAQNIDILEATINELKIYKTYGSGASQLVNGYHQAHNDLEKILIRQNGYESCIVVGSGFLANLALFETLARKGDTLFVDKEYHASGIFATNNTKAKVVFFDHNDLDDLKRQFDTKSKRKFVALEGIYSMSGNLVDKKLLEFAQQNATVILDEAHSSGTIGDDLLGVISHYELTNKNIIKMGTLSKAYGSYGAYILADQSIIDFLINRAKPIIYSTALSLFDTIYAKNAIKYIEENKNHLSHLIREKIDFVNTLGYKTDSMIVKIPIQNNQKVLEIQQNLYDQGYLVGAIRKPTVTVPQLRVILREDLETIKKFFDILKRCS